MFSNTFVMLSLTIFSVALARVIPSTVSSTDQKTFEDFLNANQNTLMELQANLMKALGVENLDQLQKKAVDQTKEFAGNLDEWANDIKKQTEGLKNNPAIAELRTSVDKAAEDFKLQHPDSTTDVQSFVEKANKGAEELIGNIKSLSESQNASMKQFAETLLSTASSKFEEITNEFKSQADAKP